jgi:hypothetical protein
MAEVIERHFEVLTDAEAFIDEQIEKAIDLMVEGAAEQFFLEHQPEQRAFRLSFPSPRLPVVEATYEHNDL